MAQGVANVAGAAGVGGEDGKIVADVVSAGAGMAEEQAKADPDASAGERLALGVKGVAKVVGATGVGGEDVKLVTNVVAAGADMAKDQAKADPEASAGERLALGVKGVAKVVGATGVGGEDGKLVTDVVVAVADMAKYQAKADPDASAAERLALGVKGGAEVAGVAVGGDIAKATSSVVSAGAEAVAKACKEQNSKDKKSEEEHAEE